MSRQRLDVGLPFGLLAGHAVIEGEVNLLLLPGMVWPGTPALPEWIGEALLPTAAWVFGEVDRTPEPEALPGAVAAVVVQALSRMPGAQATALVHQALGVSGPLRPGALASLLGISPRTAARALRGTP